MSSVYKNKRSVIYRLIFNYLIHHKYTIFLADTLSPMDDICHRGILLHELIHILQEDQEIFVNYEDRTKKHLREMDALVNHNVFLSQFGKKILYSNGFAAKFKSEAKQNLYC